MWTCITVLGICLLGAITDGVREYIRNNRKETK